ncbi:hypothetical protein BBP40_001430 [Aspergillus hancockii]|nr:hypothetical protein BBP40_001430 [Aspergillus hancockii]
MVELLPQLQGTLGFVPVIFHDYFGARWNARRMEDFLKRPERKRVLRPSPSGRVLFHNASVAWPPDGVAYETKEPKPASSSDRLILCDVSLEFPVGALSVIHGNPGAGKSLLLAAIIGEVDLLGGHIEAPSPADGKPVAFVSQTPWLVNGTIKENTLFGGPFNKARYEEVLKACALCHDLAVLPKGTLVLDDIFSALDSHVSKEIFSALTGKLCKGRTQILATHRLSLCLTETRYIVHIENNTIRYAGSTGFDESKLELVGAEWDVPLTSPAEEKKPKRIATGKVGNRAPDARGDIKVYKSYFTAAGGLAFTSIYLLSLVVKQLLGALATGPWHSATGVPLLVLIWFALGIDISMIKLQHLRSRIAFIPQDPVLFSGPVRYNLDYFQHTPDDVLEEALRRVKLLAETPGASSGLLTLDSTISNPKIIIFDKATSAADNKTDLWIQDTIRNQFNGTLIVVAHHLRTIASFDQVIVMKDGRVAEIGKPTELLGGKGLFYDLIQGSDDKELLLETIKSQDGVDGVSEEGESKTETPFNLSASISQEGAGLRGIFPLNCPRGSSLLFSPSSFSTYAWLGTPSAPKLGSRSSSAASAAPLKATSRFNVYCIDRL